ncbi:hypothetical protein NDU88_004938 [Pleurodeles waltl]|uniref:Uncharacterized protein n=1 Tax=Pleurodeles waltl TaxID=8319 RepID=A0AAV7PDY5_PLEWA|nr:hypothetical protein NDU88_004938 [Pleurodeles waltl]
MPVRKTAQRTPVTGPEWKDKHRSDAGTDLIAGVCLRFSLTPYPFLYHGDRVFHINMLTMAQLQKLCKEKGLKASKKATKLDLKTDLSTYEEVRRWQATPEEANPE